MGLLLILMKTFHLSQKDHPDAAFVVIQSAHEDVTQVALALIRGGFFLRNRQVDIWLETPRGMIQHGCIMLASPEEEALRAGEEQES